MGRYERGAQVVQFLSNAGYLGPDLLFSHGAACTDAECSAVAEHKCGVVSTPDTDLQTGMESPIAFRARDAGCRVGLGCDMMCNQGNDLVAQARLCLQSERGWDNERCEVVPVRIKRRTEEMLRMMTLGGAEASGLDGLVGSVTVGKMADLVMFNCEDVNMVPVVDPVGAIVFHSNPGNIEHVMVDGRWVKKDGKVVGMEGWDEMRRDVDNRAKRLVEQAGMVMPNEKREAMKQAIVKGWLGD